MFEFFPQVTNGNRTKHFVSYRRNEFVQMRFPKYSLPKVRHNKNYANTLTLHFTWMLTSSHYLYKLFNTKFVVKCFIASPASI